MHDELGMNTTGSRQAYRGGKSEYENDSFHDGYLLVMNNQGEYDTYQPGCQIALGIFLFVASAHTTKMSATPKSAAAMLPGKIVCAAVEVG